ncbi:hypothetical protein C0J52_10339 [Blattella germanica]|nr:hypothetical protein C0J52_10339 [Blattella germanica]
MVTVIPLDSMPFQFEYTLLMLFLRNSEVHGKLGLHRASKPNVKDYWWNWMYEVDDTRTKQKEDELKSRKEEEMKRKLRKQLERKRKEEEEEMKQKMEEKWKRKLQEELVRKKQEELERIRNEEEEQRKKEEEERQRKEKEEKEKRLTFFKKRLRVEQLRRAQGDQKNDGDKEQCKEEDNEARKKKEMEEQKKQAQKVEKKKQSVTEKKTEPLEQLRRQIEEEKVRAKRNAERRKQQYEERKRKAEEEEHWRKQQPRIPVWVEPPTAHVDLMMEERMRIMMEEEQRKRMEFEEYRRRLEEEAYRTVETETVVFDYNHGTSSQKKEDLDKLKSSDNVMNTDSATTGSAGKASNPVSRPVMKWLEKLREVSGDTDASKVPCVQDASPQQKSSDLPSLLSLKVEKPSSLCEPKRNIPASKTPQAQFIGKSPASLNPWLKTPGYFGSPSWDQTSGQYGGKIDSDASASQNIDQRSSTSGLGNMFVPNIMTNSKDQWTSGSNFYGASTTSNTHLGAVKQTTYGSNLKNTYGETSSGSVDHRLSNSNYSNMYGTGAASASASGLDQRISGSNVSNVFGTTPNFTSSSDYVNVHGIDQRSSGSSFNNYYSVPDSANKGSSSHLNSSKLYGSTGGPTVTADPRGRPGLLGPPPSIPNAYGGRHDSYSNLPNPGYGVRSDNQHQSLSGMNERNIDTYSSHSGRQLDTYNTGGAYNYAGGEFDWSKRNVTSEKDLSQDNNFSFRKTFDEARNVGSSYLGKR